MLKHLTAALLILFSFKTIAQNTPQYRASYGLGNAFPIGVMKN